MKSFSSGQIEARIYSASLLHNLFLILLNYIFLIIRRFINVKIVQVQRDVVKHIIQQIHASSNRLRSKRYQFIDTMLHNISIILSSNDHQLSIHIRVIAAVSNAFACPSTIRHCEVLTADIGDLVEWIVSQQCVYLSFNRSNHIPNYVYSKSMQLLWSLYSTG